MDRIIELFLDLNLNIAIKTLMVCGVGEEEKATKAYNFSSNSPILEEILKSLK